MTATFLEDYSLVRVVAASWLPKAAVLFLPAARAYGSLPAHEPCMKRTIFSALLALLLCGCAHYDMTLTNGVRILNVHKPVLNKGRGLYEYVDAAGKKHYITASRVVEIAPHAKNKNNTPFTP